MEYLDFFGIENKKKYLAYNINKYGRFEVLLHAKRLLHEVEENLQVEYGGYDEDRDLLIGENAKNAEFWVISRKRKR